MSRLPARSLVLAALAALILTACGRKNDLELAPDVKDTPQAQGQPETLPAGASPKRVPERSFILDGLI